MSFLHRLLLAITFAAHVICIVAISKNPHPFMTPKQWLIASSPTLRKIVYTELKNFVSMDNEMHVLVDSGLGEPVGISLDRDRAALYVADRMAQKIFRYNLLTEQKDGDVRLLVGGQRLTVLSGRNVSWVSVDLTGDVYYSDGTSNSINRIKLSTMEDIASGLFLAEDLQVVSEKEQEAAASAKLTSSLQSDHSTTTDPPEPMPHILSIYESSVNPHVSAPGGIFSDGLNLFWANQVNGQTIGSAVRGECDPQEPPVLAPSDQPAPFPSTPLTNVTSSTYGLTKSNSYVFLSSVVDKVGVVYGFSATTPDAPVYTFANGLGEPRGLVWDGDQTVYVADYATNTIWSFPIGRLISDAPLKTTVVFDNPWGLALMSKSDPAFGLRTASHGADTFNGALGNQGSKLLFRAFVVIAMSMCAASMS